MDTMNSPLAAGAAGWSAELKLRQLGIDLPGVPASVGNFEVGVMNGSTLILSGQGPVMEDGSLATGQVGTDVSTEDAYNHARRTGLVLVSAMKTFLGSLDHVERVLRVFGMVNAAPGYLDHPKVINGCSDLLLELFGDRGRHVRCAVGVGSLPGNISVEIEATVSVSPNGSSLK